PIGGKTQNSDYAIDCRFPVKTLVRRIRNAAKLRRKVRFITCSDWQGTLDRVEGLGYEQDEVFYYLDPPFFGKAEKLYRYFFKEGDHQSLHDRLIRLKQPWLLSYDAAEKIVATYSHNSTGP